MSPIELSWTAKKIAWQQKSVREGVTKHTTPMYCPKNMELTLFKANNALLNKNRFKYDLNLIIGECIHGGHYMINMSCVSFYTSYCAMTAKSIC